MGMNVLIASRVNIYDHEHEIGRDEIDCKNSGQCWNQLLLKMEYEIWERSVIPKGVEIVKKWL